MSTSRIGWTYKPRRHIGWTNTVQVHGDIAILSLRHDDGREAAYLIDADDAERVSKCRWQINSGPRPYAITSSVKYEGTRATTPLHRFILGRKPGDKMHVDHLNREVTDNRKVNLETVTPRENLLRIPSNHAWARGVSLSARGRYKVYTRFKPGLIVFPTFRTLESAQGYHKDIMSTIAAYEAGEIPLPRREDLVAMAATWQAIGRQAAAESQAARASAQ